ncbi:GNAT family N-acetyltransferase [Flexivirga caeni]|uniref:GNAT family N-acetyltransferase n=1 Tax=Flexivirga caeni TaxID=2294115 RepID=A0A3M9M2V8_9MICO|nr:GNAT family N-acetyltransferase [Flexivirga caeni]RNI19475.1 GNAT family N-acetyltransferase [Flexivirga caeni]
MTIQQFRPEHVAPLGALFAGLPEGDRTFIKEDVSSASVAAWPDAPGWRWVDVAGDGAIDGFAALLPLSGWSDHVAELRLVVAPRARGRGIGRLLAQHAVTAAIRLGLLKVVVELPAVQERTTEMFLGLGFSGEALLRDHFRDRDGNLQDLIMLAYLGEEHLATLAAVGIDDLVEGH